MRNATPKRDAQLRRYRVESRAWLIGKVCACCGRAHEPDVFELTVHHMKGRRGDLLRDQRFWLPLCWEPCHRRATTEPLWALANGFSMLRGDAA